MADEPVPKLPYGRGFKWSWAQIIKIVMTAGMLVAILVLARPCSEAVSNFMMRFDNKGSAAKQMPKPNNVEKKEPQDYELIRGDMTEAEQRAAIERAKARAAGSAVGSGSVSGSGSDAVPRSGSASR